MKSSAIAVFLLAGFAAAAPASLAPAKRQCSAPAPAPPSTTAPVPVPTEAPAPAPPTTDAPAPPTTAAPAPPTETSAPPTPGGGGEAPSGGSPVGTGPFFSVYADTGVEASNFPDVGAMGDFNDLLLAFWLSPGVWDAAYIWTTLDEATRKGLLDSYHAAGKVIRISTFGATEFPLLSGGDPVTIGNNIGEFVKTWGLDGVDIDYEDSGSFESATGGGEDFLITLTRTLREQLPPPYVISHAPQAPYFTTGTKYPNKAYLKVHEEVGDMIDFYNVQFYNQGQGTYDTCEGLFVKGPESWPGTSVFEIEASGIPISKIVIGKPATAADGNNGHMSAQDIGACITANDGKAGGVMVWQYSHAGADWIAAAKGNL